MPIYSSRSQLFYTLGIALLGFFALLVELSIFRVPALWFNAFLSLSVLAMALLVGFGQAYRLVSGMRNRGFWIGAGLLGWMLSLLIAHIAERPFHYFDIVVATSSTNGYKLPAAFLVSGLITGSIIGAGQSRILGLSLRDTAKWIGTMICFYMVIWMVAGTRPWVV
jgi:hypothetical protein